MAAVSMPPPPPRPLLGRERELKVIQSLVRAHRMVAVEGPAGGGKTALLAALAALLARAKKPVRYVPASGFTSEDDLWCRLLAEMGKSLQAGMAGRLLVRPVIDALEAGHVTLLLDDIDLMPRSVALSVLPDLLAGLRHGRVVVASSEPLPLSEPLSAEVPRVAVRGLPADAAIQLAGAARPGRRPLARRDRARLAKMTGGHPLALRLAAAHPELAARVLANDAMRPDVDLEADLVRPALDDLTAAEHDALALATCAGGRLPAPIARFLAVPAQALGHLTDRALVDADDGGWTVAPLVAAAMDERLATPAARDLSRRLGAAASAAWEAEPANVRWVLIAIEQAFRVGDHGGAARLLARARGLYLTRGLARDYLSALARLPTEVSAQHPRLELDRAHLHARFVGPNALSRTLLMRLVEGSDRAIAASALAELAEIDLLDGDLALALSRGEESARTLRRVGTRPELARALVRMGRLRVEARQWAHGREAYEEAISLLTREGDLALLTDALLGAGQCRAEEGRHADAHEAFLRALHLQKQLPPEAELSRADALERPLSSRNLRAETHLRLGLHHRDRGQFKEALSALARAERAFRQAGDVRAAAEAAVSSGEVLLAMGRHNRARLVFEQGLIELREAGSARGVAVAQLDIGLLALEGGDLKGAGQALAEAIAGFTTLRDERGTRAVQIAQATMMRLSGNRLGARVLLEGLLVEARRDQRGSEEGEILHRLASQALEEGFLDEARARAREAAAAFEATAHHKGLERVRGMLVRVAFLTGDLRAADALAVDEVQAARRRDDPRGLAMALTQLAEIRLEQRRPRDALEVAKEAMQLREGCGDERGLVASHRLSTEVYISTGAAADARRTASRGLELARSRGMSSEQAHLHLLLGALSLAANRPGDARAHADAASARSTGLADLQLLALKLAHAATLSGGDHEAARRLEDTWFDRMQSLPAPRVRHLFDRLTRLGLDTSRRCVVRSGGDVRATTLDRAALVDSLAVDLSIDTVRRRVRANGHAWHDMADRPSLLAVLASAVRKPDHRPPVSTVARQVWGLAGKVGATEVAAAVAELASLVTPGGRPAVALSGSNRDRLELARGLRALLFEEEG